jgi:L-amino acid N-acyltransferase YncA
MEIKTIVASYYPEISRIYLEGILTGNATFQTKAPDWNEWDKSHLPNSRIAAFENNTMVGWAALSPVSSRCIYAGVAEVSIYVLESERGKGIGKLLLQQLILESENNDLWTLQSSIFPENIGSIKIHEQCGFRQIGFKEKVGKMNGIWRDNILMERRSKIVGV